MDFNYLQIELNNQITTLWINNPSKANCLNETLWYELGKAVKYIEQQGDSKVIVLRSRGKHFSSGIDIHFLSSLRERCAALPKNEQEDFLHQTILKMQQSFDQFELCQLPIIAMIHGVCIGGALDLISACDMRFCTIRSAFSILETKLGIVADMGSLQRLRFILSESDVRYLALTSEIFSGRKAYQLGLVNRYFFSRKRMQSYVYQLAQQLCDMPYHQAVQGTKLVLNYSRDKSVGQGLAFVAKLNAKQLIDMDFKV